MMRTYHIYKFIKQVLFLHNSLTASDIKPGFAFTQWEHFKVIVCILLAWLDLEKVTFILQSSVLFKLEVVVKFVITQASPTV